MKSTREIHVLTYYMEVVDVGSHIHTITMACMMFVDFLWFEAHKIFYIK